MEDGRSANVVSEFLVQVLKVTLIFFGNSCVEKMDSGVYMLKKKFSSVALSTLSRSYLIL